MMKLSPIAASIFIFLNTGTGDAFSTFSSECNLPPPQTNYVSGPNTRGTLSILWNCVSIILLCTWSIQHLNVPARRKKASGFWQQQWWTILDSRRKIKWMLFAILVPEYLVGKALNDRLAAKFGVPGMKESGWEEVHVHLANMGYFVLHIDESLEYGARDTNVKQRPSTGTPPVTAPPNKGPDLNEASGFLLQTYSGTSSGDQRYSKQQNTKRVSAAKLTRGRLRNNASALDNLTRLRGSSWALTAHQWDCARMDGYVEVPNLDAHDLEKLDRGGKLVKLLALMQVGYLMIQLIGRQVAGLSAAQLEITALAFSASSLVTYILLWGKPQGVESIHIVEAKRIPTVEEVERIADVESNFLWTNYRFTARRDDQLRYLPIPNDAGHWGLLPSKSLREYLGYNDESLALSFGSLVGGVLFGGAHCLAWNFHFPSRGEQVVWRICSVIISALPVLSILPFTFWMRLNPAPSHSVGKTNHPKFRRLVGVVLVFGCIVPYILARVFLIVEVFRTLFYLPPDAFIETWSGSLPHFG